MKIHSTFITYLDSLTANALLLRSDGFSVLVRAELVEASAQQGAPASYEISKSYGNRLCGLELLDKLDSHFQTAA